MSKPYEFYAEAELLNDLTHGSESVKAGEKGFVFGRSKDEAGAWSYAIYFPSLSACWCAPHEQLSLTGVKGTRSDFYSGEFIRVCSDKSGCGTLICKATGNACGTDMWAVGHCCPCKSCQLWLANKP